MIACGLLLLNLTWACLLNRQFRISISSTREKSDILTLFAIAKELEKSGNISPMVEADLAVGLPPEHYALRQRFADYFKRGRVNFVFNGAPICLMIRHVFVYPQAYAAVVPQAGRLKEIPRTFIIDIGGYIGNHPEVMAENAKIVITVQSTPTDEQTLAKIQQMIDASVERLKDSMKLQVLQEQHGGQTAPTGPNQQDLDDMLDNLTIFDQ